MDSSNTSCVEAPNDGSGCLGALQGQWPAREAAPRSSKLNSVTRAGQQQHSTPTRDALTCAVTPTVTCPTTMHYYYYTATIRTFKLGDGWGGGCQNWPHLNLSGRSLLPCSILPRRSSQCPVCGGRNGLHIITGRQPEGTSMYQVALFTIFQLHDAQTLFFSATQYFSAI